MEAFRDTDWDDDNFLADQLFDVTLRELIGMPAQNADDATCAIEWIVREGNGFGIIGGESLYGLALAIRNYLAA